MRQVGASKPGTRNGFTSLVIGLASLTGGLVGARAHAFSPGLDDQPALQSATRAMCQKSVVLLGEASHGDGHADAFRVALVDRLVSDCGFNAVLFESSFYEFIPLTRDARQGHKVSPEAIAAAVGGLWKFDREVKPLFGFLAEQVNTGRLRVGGLDFQVGGLEQPYTNEQMFVELLAGLPAEHVRNCTDAFRSQADAVVMNVCASEIEASLATATSRAPEIRERQRSLTNLRAWMAHVNGTPEEFAVARERAMFENLRVFIGQHASKVPVRAIV